VKFNKQFEKSILAKDVTPS